MNDKKYISFHIIASVRCVLAKVRFFLESFLTADFLLFFFFIPLFFLLFHSASTFLEGAKKGGGGVAKTSRGKFHRNMICRHSKEEAPIIPQLVKLKNVFIFPVHSLIPPLWCGVCASSNILPSPSSLHLGEKPTLSFAIRDIPEENIFLFYFSIFVADL